MFTKLNLDNIRIMDDSRYRSGGGGDVGVERPHESARTMHMPHLASGSDRSAIVKKKKGGSL